MFAQRHSLPLGGPPCCGMLRRHAVLRWRNGERGRPPSWGNQRSLHPKNDGTIFYTGQYRIPSRRLRLENQASKALQGLHRCFCSLGPCPTAACIRCGKGVQSGPWRLPLAPMQARTKQQITALEHCAQGRLVSSSIHMEAVATNRQRQRQRVGGDAEKFASSSSPFSQSILYLSHQHLLQRTTASTGAGSSATEAMQP